MTDQRITEHVIKVKAPYFDALLDGTKTFEVRRNDRAYRTGDTLVLLDAERCECPDRNCAVRRPPLKRVISYVYSGDPRLGVGGGLQPGVVVLGLAAEPADEATR